MQGGVDWLTNQYHTAHARASFANTHQRAFQLVTIFIVASNTCTISEHVYYGAMSIQCRSMSAKMAKSIEIITTRGENRH